MDTPVTWVLVTLVVSYALYYHKAQRSRLPLPPGPKGLPLVGNIFVIPKAYEWRAYHQWSKDHGSDIIYLNMMGKSTIVLDTAEAVSELLEKRSSIYSSRPRFVVLNELIGPDFNVGIMKYGEIWRRHRRLTHSYFGPNAPSNYRPVSLFAARRLMNRLLDDPKDIKRQLYYMAGDSIMSICYGLDVRTADGAFYLDTVQRGNEAVLQALVPGKFLVEFLPILKYVPAWLPGAGFKKRFREWGQYTNDMVKLPFSAARMNFAAGTCQPCFTCSSLQIETSSQHSVQEKLVQDVAGAMYGAGSETTASALSSCILGLLSRPAVLHRAREDLDRVVKPGNLPEFDDIPSLPFITAIAKETLRWREVTPLGVPHYVEVEHEYKGYRIPAGTMVLSNIWALLHDEEVYPDPFVFKPERFMNGDEYNHETKDPEFACWGFGRRICPGRYMGFSSIWITIASLIYAFNIEKDVDADGRTIEPDPQYTSGLVYAPEPFPCRITPRSEEVAKLIRGSNLDPFSLNQ